MKEVLTLHQSLHVANRLPLGKEISVGEFFSLMENNVKREFFCKLADRIHTGRQYVFEVTCEDVRTDEWQTVELFKFSVFEIEDDEEIVKIDRVTFRPPW